jgi:alpha-tubulin suppressor-like RCC1 family protein
MPTSIRFSPNRVILCSVFIFALAQVSCRDSTAADPFRSIGDPVASISVTPAQESVSVYSQRQLVATVIGASGAVLSNRTITWVSSDPGLVTAYENGSISGQDRIGTATVTATCEGKSASVIVTVNDPVTAVNVIPLGALIAPGNTFLPRALVRTTIFPSTSPVTWTTSNPAVASVDANGLVTGVSIGSATITAATAGKSGTTSVQVIQLSSMGTLTSVQTGDATTCAVNTSGAGFCWGYGPSGQLGNGDTKSAFTPVPVSGGVDFNVIAPGQDHTCGLTTSGAAYCWGANDNGQLGDNTHTPHLTPALVVGGHTFTSITSGLGTCAISTDSTAYCWGLIQGAGGFGNSSVPTPLNTGNKFVVVSAGGSHDCAIATDGGSYCWGGNVFGELGGSAISYIVNSPLYVTSNQTFVTLSAGVQGTCGLVASGDAYCWGVVPGANAWKPIAGGIAFSSIDVGWRHVCGVDRGGAGYCWGVNTNGELGNGTNTRAPTPSESPPYTSVPGGVVGGLTYSFIQTGMGFSCGLTTNSVVYCWGANASGQLGNGTSNDSNVASKVVGQP